VPARFTMGEIARMAEEIERNGLDFYTNFAEIAADSRLRTLCERLAIEEGGHRTVFAAIFAQEPHEEAATFPGDGDALIRTIARESVFAPMSGAQVDALSSGGTPAFLEFALSKEHAAIELFSALKPGLSRRAARLVERIIVQEREHVRLLEALRSE